MKSRFLDSFQKRIIISVLCSGIITTILALGTLFGLGRLERWLLFRQYRSQLIDRNGIDPVFKMTVFIIGCIIVFAICFILCMQPSVRYIKAITKGVRKISEGNFDAAVPVWGEDELADIADGLNAMTDKIKIVMEREREAEKTKNDLITSVAHDLRTPLTSIIGYLELIKNHPHLADGDWEKYLDIAYTKAKRLESLTDDLFGFTKLSHGEMKMTPGFLDIVKLLSQLLDEFYPIFQERGLEYEFSSNHASIIIEADGNLLARLFDNLINNAVKYGAEGKVVLIRLDRDKEDGVVIQVINYGRVIPEKDLGSIFQKFYRVDPSRSQDTGGTGLGLAIAKSVVEMHGGTINVKSDLNGTVFEVHLFAKLRTNVVYH